MVREPNTHWSKPTGKRVRENLFFCFAFFVGVLPLAGKDGWGVWINSELFADTASIENNFTGSWNNFLFGINAAKSSIINPGNPMKILPAMGYEKDEKIKVYFFSNIDGGTLSHWESKINIKFKNTWFDLGIGKNNLVHLGFEYGTKTNFGFGAGIVKQKESKADIRAEIWKYWESLQIFTGMRKSGDDIVVLLSRPAIDKWALRLISIYDWKKTGFKFLQLSFGTISRKGYYGLHFLDSWFFLHDTQIVGQDPIQFADRNPFRYIPPPLAWMIKDFGVRIQRNVSNGIRTDAVEVVKYLSGDVYAEALYTDNAFHFFGIGIGKVTENIKYVFRIYYGTDQKKIKAVLKLRIFSF